VDFFDASAYCQFASCLENPITGSLFAIRWFDPVETLRVVRRRMDSGRVGIPGPTLHHRFKNTGGWEVFGVEEPAGDLPRDVSEEVLNDKYDKPSKCPTPQLDTHCSDCAYPETGEGTHRGCTIEHGHVGCELANVGSTEKKWGTPMIRILIIGSALMLALTTPAAAQKK
jgi:hypothetical protein